MSKPTEKIQGAPAATIEMVAVPPVAASRPAALTDINTLVDDQMAAVSANSRYLAEDHVSLGLASALESQKDVLVIARSLNMGATDDGVHDGSLTDVEEIIRNSRLNGIKFITFTYRKGPHFMSVVVDVAKKEVAFSNSTAKTKAMADEYYDKFNSTFDATLKNVLNTKFAFSKNILY